MFETTIQLVKLGIFSQVRVKITTTWNHHLDIHNQNTQNLQIAISSVPSVEDYAHLSAASGVFKRCLPPISFWLGWKQLPFGQVFHNFRAYQNPMFSFFSKLKVVIFIFFFVWAPPQCWNIPMFKVISMNIFLASSFPTPTWLCSQRCWKSFPCHCSHLWSWLRWTVSVRGGASKKQAKINPLTPLKLTWQLEIHRLKMYFLLKLVIFEGYVSFRGGGKNIRKSVNHPLEVDQKVIRSHLNMKKHFEEISLEPTVTHKIVSLS